MGRVELVVRSEGQFRRAYACKRLRRRLVDDPDARAMFVSEARIAGLVHHPNVVSVIDVGEDDEGPFLVMDYVEGMSLSQLIKALIARQERLPIQIAVRIFLDVARGLAAAHELTDHRGADLGLVHRDVSPQNILIGFDGVARLTDFGIAKAAGIGERTSTGVLKGKFGYFAPEQLQFLPATRKTDLFSFGVVLYEALTARRLHRAATLAETANRIAHEPPPDPYLVREDLHPDLVALLFRLLAKEPAERPSGAAEVAMELEGILSDLRLSEPPHALKDFLAERFTARAKEERARIEAVTTTAAAEELDPPVSGRRRVGWLVAAGAVSLGLGAAAMLWFSAPSASLDRAAPTAAPDRAERTDTEPRVAPPVAEPGVEPAPEETRGEGNGLADEATEQDPPRPPRTGRATRRRRPAAREPTEREEASPAPPTAPEARPETVRDTLLEWDR